MKRPLLLIMAATLCFSAHGLFGEDRPLATRVEHFFVASDQAQSLFAFFRDTFQLPEVWSFKKYDSFSSGGLTVGNAVLEFASFPKKANNPIKTEFGGIAFEPTANADATRVELTKRNIPHTGARSSGAQTPGRQVSVGWSNVGLTDLPPRNVLIFFCDYKDRQGVAQGRKAASDELARRTGGPLGIAGVAEITVGVQNLEETLSKWTVLLAPSPQISDDAFVFDSGPRIRLVHAESPGIQGIILKVRSLDQVANFLGERGLLAKDDTGHIAISPAAIGGLSIRLIDDSQVEESGHPLLGCGRGVDHVGIAVRDLEKARRD
jgi:hypothetical protein